MKKQVQLALAGAALGMTSLVAVTHSATAQVVQFPKLAQGINTWMARAMDDCPPPGTVSVVSPPSPQVPSFGCLQANGDTTDNTLGMKTAKLRVTNRGRIALLATGFTLGDELRVRLWLRVTQKNVPTKHPLATRNVTFSDVTVDCPQSPDAFNARPNGAVIGTTSLAACLTNNSDCTAAKAPSPCCTGAGTGNCSTDPAVHVNLQKGNIEMLGVSLVNALTGKTVAVPGVLR